MSGNMAILLIILGIVNICIVLYLIYRVQYCKNRWEDAERRVRKYIRFVAKEKQQRKTAHTPTPNPDTDIIPEKTHGDDEYIIICKGYSFSLTPHEMMSMIEAIGECKINSIHTARLIMAAKVSKIHELMIDDFMDPRQ